MLSLFRFCTANVRGVAGIGVPGMQKHDPNRASHLQSRAPALRHHNQPLPENPQIQASATSQPNVKRYSGAGLVDRTSRECSPVIQSGPGTEKSIPITSSPCTVCGFSAIRLLGDSTCCRANTNGPTDCSILPTNKRRALGTTVVLTLILLVLELLLARLRTESHRHRR